MQKKDYHGWSKDKLIHEYKELLKRKKFGIVWEDRIEEVAEQCKSFLPVLKDETTKSFSTDKSGINHVFIEGDNYHALSVLNYTHKKKIDVIFIDPPYNTGNRSWRYNNDYVEKEDRFRHSKWLSFMSKRLRLARNLLTDKGIIVVTIDDYELFTLGLLMDEIFFENNKIGVLVVESNPRGRTTNKFFATSHEYCLIYAKNANVASIENVPLTEEQKGLFNLEDDISSYRLLPFRRSGGLSTPEERPNSHYPIFYCENTGKIDIAPFKGASKILPIDSSGRKRVWRQTRPSLMDAVERGDMVIKKNGKGYVVYMKDRIKEGRKAKTVWINPKYDASSHGTILLDKILDRRKAFDYPKSLYAVLDILSVLIANNKNAIILDFFAGSGTTGHAVLELNKRDEGKRQFILCTDNQDNNGSGTKIASDICYPRIKRIMTGYSVGGKKIAGLGDNLKYYSGELVGNIRTDNDKRVLTSRSLAMLCLAEATFDEVVIKKGLFAIYENQKQMTGIVFDEDAISDFKIEAKKHKKPIVVYVFSYDHTYNEEDFEGLNSLKIVKPIPEVILNVYRKIYKDLYRPRNL
ncbi:MAG: site-specific DNA-methyltransferase [Candidatus Saganbacteria bacterium]|nr:site-specific DNA-methyltransferase [Candidatus Saganbacteria bacterium]